MKKARKQQQQCQQNARGSTKRLLSPWVSFWQTKESNSTVPVKTNADLPDGDREETLMEAPSNQGTLSPVSLHRGNSNQKRQKKKDMRRKNEDSLAVVFMIIIFIFLICHAPRIILDIHELMTIKQSEYCNGIGAFSYSAWSVILLSISHFLLVVNSSVNMIVYCLLGSRFRKEIRKIFDAFVPHNIPT